MICTACTFWLRTETLSVHCLLSTGAIYQSNDITDTLLVISLTTDDFCEWTSTGEATLTLSVAEGTRCRSVFRGEYSPNHNLSCADPGFQRYVQALQPRRTWRTKAVVEPKYVARCAVVWIGRLLSEQLVRRTRSSLWTAESIPDTCGYARVVDFKCLSVAREDPRRLWPVVVRIQEHSTAGARR